MASISDEVMDVRRRVFRTRRLMNDQFNILCSNEGRVDCHSGFFFGYLEGVFRMLDGRSC